MSNLPKVEKLEKELSKKEDMLRSIDLKMSTHTHDSIIFAALSKYFDEVSKDIKCLQKDIMMLELAKKLKEEGI